MSDKDLVLRTVRKLPDGLSLGEILEQIAIMIAIREGQEDVKAGRVLDHEEVKRRYFSWNSNSSGRNVPAKTSKISGTTSRKTARVRQTGLIEALKNNKP